MTYKKNGFSIMEALVVLLIVSVTFIGLSKVITKKKVVTGANRVHGKWVCKNINGVEKSVILSNIDAEIPADNDSKWTQGCVPPKPAGAKFFTKRGTLIDIPLQSTLFATT